MAANCCVTPRAALGLAGIIEIDVSFAAVAASLVDAEEAANGTDLLAGPFVTVSTLPCESAVLLTEDDTTGPAATLLDAVVLFVVLPAPVTSGDDEFSLLHPAIIKNSKIEKK